MNERIHAGMLEATHLTRVGRLLEATATIQRTLRGMLAPDAAADTSGQTTDAPIEGEFRVMDAAPVLTEGSVRAPDRRPCIAIMGALLPPGGADVALGRQQESAELTDTHPSPRAAGPTEAPAVGQPSWASERNENTSRVPWAMARFRALLRPNWRGYSGPASQPRPIPDEAPDVVPDGGQFLTGSYTNHAGTRSYKLYIPSSYSGQALPLVVMLHGCTQTPDDFAAGTRMNTLAEEHECLVLYPAQSPAANGSKCWNWFKAADQHRGQGEPSIIAGITRQIVSAYQVDARRVYVAGLSAGGAMAAIMGMAYSDLYAAVGIHSGLPYAVAHDLPSALAAMQQGGPAPYGQRDLGVPGADPCPQVVPTIVFHGDRDSTVHPRNGDQVIAQWATVHANGGPHSETGTNPQVTVQRGQVPDGHAYTRAIYHDTSGQVIMEQWLVHGAGHAWSGGSPSGSFTDPKGPDAAQEMLRFFYEHQAPPTH
jgi:poly(hydroxyalkanoate) depolymerase family esterase